MLTKNWRSHTISNMLYTVGAAAFATGVSAHRLRTWERRYGVPAPLRGTTGRRLYDEDDLALIRRMAALVASGLSAASAAAVIHDESTVTTSIHLAALPEVDARVVALVDAAQTFDESAVRELLEAAQRTIGVEAAVEQLALLALVEAGNRWERADMTIAAEHLLSEAVRQWMSAYSSAVVAPAPAAPVVLVACPEDERHDLGALALALLLRHAGLRVAYLGSDVPTSALVEAARCARFDALCLSITGTSSLPVARLALGALHAAGGSMRLYVGGQAVASARADGANALPAVRLPASIIASAQLVASQLHSALRVGRA